MTEEALGFLQYSHDDVREDRLFATMEMQNSNQKTSLGGGITGMARIPKAASRRGVPEAEALWEYRGSA